MSFVGIGDSGIRHRLGNKLKAGFSRGAVAVRPGRDSEPVVWSFASEDVDDGWLPRGETRDDSSLFFIVWSFLSRLVFEHQYYDLC